MTSQEHASDEWAACPTGELRRTVKRLKARRRDRQLARVVAATGTLVVLVAIGAMAVQQLGQSEDPPGSIACSEVKAHLPAYVAGELDSGLLDSGLLDSGLAARIEEHLGLCPFCKRAYERLVAENDKTASSRLAATPGVILAIGLPVRKKGSGTNSAKHPAGHLAIGS